MYTIPKQKTPQLHNSRVSSTYNVCKYKTTILPFQVKMKNELNY